MAKGTQQTGRSAKTGQFVTVDYAKKHPNTTVIERTPKPQPKGSGK